MHTHQGILNSSRNNHTKTKISKNAKGEVTVTENHYIYSSLPIPLDNLAHPQIGSFSNASSEELAVQRWFALPEAAVLFFSLLKRNLKIVIVIHLFHMSS